MNRLRNLGRIRINMELINEEPREIIRAFSGMIVLNLQQHYECDEIEYVVYHSSFRTIEKGKKIPMYDIIFDGGNILIKERENE